MEAPARKTSRKARIVFAIAVFGTFAILYLLVAKLATLGDFWGALSSASPLLVALAIALVLVNIGLAAVRLSLTFGVLGAHVPFGRSVETVLATFPLAVITPSRAGDAARAVALRDLLPIPEGVSAVLAEKLVDVHSLLVLALVGSATVGLWSMFAVALAGLLGQYLATFLLLRHAPRLENIGWLQRFGDKPRRLVSGLEHLVARPRSLLLLAGVSVMAFANAVGLAYALTEAVGADLPLTVVMALWPLSLFAGLLPITIGGIGTRDGAFVGLLTFAGIAFHSGAVLAATVLYAVVATALPAVLGLWPMLRHARALAAPSST